MSLQFVDQELQKLNAQAAVLQTARMAYAEALKEVSLRWYAFFNNCQAEYLPIVGVHISNLPLAVARPASGNST